MTMQSAPLSDGQPAIVSKLSEMPAPTAFSIQPAKKTKDGLDLEVHVTAEIVPGSGLVKRGVVKPNIPSFGAFELYCDEGAVIGGTDTAPAPLSYLAAGIAFCLLTHLKGYIDAEKLKVSSIKIEQIMKFQSRIPGMTAAPGGQMEGHSKGLETFIIVDSQETSAVIADMVETAQRACMALQTVINAVPSATTIIENKA